MLQSTISGSVVLHTGPDDVRGTLDLQASHLGLQQGSTTLAHVQSADLQGELGRDRYGTLWARKLSLLSEELTMQMQRARMHDPTMDHAGFQIDASFNASGDWLTPILVHHGVPNVVLHGNAAIALQLDGSMDDPLKTTQGHVTVRAAEGSFQKQRFSRSEVDIYLTPGRFFIKRGVIALQDGEAEVQGEFGLFAETLRPNDLLTLTLRHVPVHLVQPLDAFGDKGHAALHTYTVLNGQVELFHVGNGHLNGTVDVHTGETTRQVQQDDQILARASLPALRLTAIVSQRSQGKPWRFGAIRVQGSGLTVELTNTAADWTPPQYAISSALHLHVSGAVFAGLMLGLLPEGSVSADAIALSGNVGLHGNSEKGILLWNSSFDGHLRFQALEAFGTAFESPEFHLNIAQGRLTFELDEAHLAGGSVRFQPASFVDLQGPDHAFALHLAIQQLHLQTRAGKKLSFLGPLDGIEPSKHKPMELQGKITGELHLAGTYQDRPGWSTSVNGKGSLQITQGAIDGMSRMSGFLHKIVMLPQNIVDETVKALEARRGQPQDVLVGLGKSAIAFQPVTTPIRVQAGVIRLQDNLILAAPEVRFILNGQSTLEGELNYNIESDFISRLFFAEVTSLPDHIPILGKLIHAINPFDLVNDIDLNATVSGNVSRRTPTGQPAVHVDMCLRHEATHWHFWTHHHHHVSSCHHAASHTVPDGDHRHAPSR